MPDNTEFILMTSKIIQLVKEKENVLIVKCFSDKLSILKHALFNVHSSAEYIYFMVINNGAFAIPYSRYIKNLMANTFLELCELDNFGVKLTFQSFEINIISKNVLAENLHMCKTDNVCLVIFDEEFNQISDQSLYTIMDHFLTCNIITLKYADDLCYDHEIDFVPDKWDLTYRNISKNNGDNFIYYNDDCDMYTINRLNDFYKSFDVLVHSLPTEATQYDEDTGICDNTVIGELKEIMKEMKNVIQGVGVHCVPFYCDHYVMHLHTLQLNTYDINDRTLISALIWILIQIRVYNSTEEETESIYELISSKCIELLNFLTPITKNDSVIIFTEKPIIARCLLQLIKSILDLNELHDIGVEVLIGNDNVELKYNREQICIRNVKNIITKFNKKDVNILIVSRIQNELKNIQLKCQCVLFDGPKTYSSYVTAKELSSAMYIFIRNNEQECKLNKENLANYLDFYSKTIQGLAENYTRSNNTGKILTDVELITEPEEPDDFNFKFVKETLQTDDAVFAALERYISSLPQDKFVKLTVRKGNIKSKSGRFISCLQLPINCKVKTVFSKSWEDAAAIALAKLYHLGELNFDLSPKTFKFETTPLNISDNCEETICFPNWQIERKHKKTYSGSKKTIRTVRIKYPDSFVSCNPKPGQFLFVHVILFEPMFEPGDKNTKRYCYNLWKSCSGYGILSSKKFPPVCRFPIFADLGSLLVTIKHNAFTVVLDEEQINSIWKFHKGLAVNVIEYVKCFMVSNKHSENDGYLIIPIQSVNNSVNEFEINWEVIEKPTTVIAPRDAIEVKYEDYVGKVIIPWYRELISTRYYVITDICNHLNPESILLSDMNKTYKEYYEEKYDLVLKNKDQPLLEVFAVFRMSNNLKPLQATKHIRRRRGELHFDYDEILIPEFCTIQNFEPVYLLKAFTLPTILHRLHYLLLANDLRNLIADRVFPDQPVEYDESETLPMNEKFLNTDVDEKMNVTPLTNVVELLEKCDKLFTEQPSLVDLENTEFNLLQLYQHYCHDNAFQCADDSFIPNYRHRQKTGQLTNAPILNVLADASSFNHPTQHEVLQVITASKSQDVLKEDQPPMLGESFLNYIISICLYTMCPKMSSKQLYQLLHIATSKRNVYYCSLKNNFSSYLKICPFDSFYEFMAPGFDVPEEICKRFDLVTIPADSLFSCEIPLEEIFEGRISHDTYVKIHEQLIDFLSQGIKAKDAEYAQLFLKRQQLDDKTVILFLKSLICLYLKKCGITNCCKLLQYFGFITFEKTTISKILEKPVECPYTLGVHDVEYFSPKCVDLERKLGYTFKNRNFLLFSLVHVTCDKVDIQDCYQRLEFIGNAVLDFLITLYLFQYCDKKYDEILNIRNGLVNNITYASLSAELGVHKYVLLSRKSLHDMIEKFLLKKQHISPNQMLYLMEESECDRMDMVDVPKILSDLFKSIIGAIYLDSNKDLQIVWKVVYNVMIDTIDEFCFHVPQDPISILRSSTYEVVFDECIELDEFNFRICLHIKSFMEQVEKSYFGHGVNKKHAKQSAAKLAIRDIVKDLLFS